MGMFGQEQMRRLGERVSKSQVRTIASLNRFPGGLVTPSSPSHHLRSERSPRSTASLEASLPPHHLLITSGPNDRLAQPLPWRPRYPLITFSSPQVRTIASLNRFPGGLVTPSSPSHHLRSERSPRSTASL